jgi:predicted O-linked N-acetylglucosamine transferase (SPINDLY family)
MTHERNFRPRADAPGVDPRLQQALLIQGRGDIAGAEALCHQVLQGRPDDIAALHLLGVLLTQSGRAQRALECLARAAGLDPLNAAVHSNLGNAWLSLGRSREALTQFERALALRPDYGIAAANRGIALLQLGRFRDAVGVLSAALERSPQNHEVRLHRAIALEKLGQPAAAVADYEHLLADRPEDVRAGLHRAALLGTLGRHAEALEACDRMLRTAPGQGPLHNQRGIELLALGRFEDALASFDRALQCVDMLAGPASAASRQSHASASNNRALALRHLWRLQEALDSVEAALALRPDYAEAHNNRGWILLQLGRAQDAEASLQQALWLRADFVEALTNLGAVHKHLGRLSEASSYFQRALALDPDCQDALGGLGMLLLQSGRTDEAAGCFRHLMTLFPDDNYAIGNLLEAQLRRADWSNWRSLRDKLLGAVAAGHQAARPFFFLAVSDDPAAQLTCARQYAASHSASTSQVPDRAGRRSVPAIHDPQSKLHVAYVSGDLGEHAVSYLLAGLFEHHDRRRFDITAISLRPFAESAIGRRVRAAFGRCLEVDAWSDAAIAARMRELQVDIAVDLSGHTGAARPGIWSDRAAPLQVNYLGFPGTMGSDCMDYLIADHFVIPEGQEVHYAEKIIYLPQSFQANDDRRVIDPVVPTRADCALPEQGFVFCSFNNTYKINPPCFALWLGLLAAVPGAVLWILGDDDAVEANLRATARAAGVSADRLVFARRWPYARHLARLRLADLFLDSLPFNGGTTVSDALWAGVPVLTCAGRAFAARMAGSLLHAVGLPELVTATPQDYEALALRLARDDALLTSWRSRLAANRLRYPLFDTARFCTSLEAAYRAIWERQLAGLPPASIHVLDAPGSR